MTYPQQAVERFLRTRRGLIPQPDSRVHVIAAMRKPRLEPFFAEKYHDWRAICGRKVRVVLAVAWDEDRPNACPDCIEKMRAIQFGTAEPPFPQYI